MRKKDKIAAGIAIGSGITGAGLIITVIVSRYRFRYWTKRLHRAQTLENAFQQARWDLLDDIRGES